MNLIDEAKIYLESGKGGNGCVSFRREKFVQYGGPDGGNGGHGGNIIFVSNKETTTLLAFRYHQHFKADAGENGKSSNRAGKNGKDLFIQVPIGTQIYNENQQHLLYDFTDDNQSLTFLQGGRRGIGNACFKSSQNQSPRRATKGQSGEEMCVWLKLKLLSDVGIIGKPNSGKSTLLSKITNAKPKIADYPFTTLGPNLGITMIKDRELVIADIPGLIEGAHLGHGLGDRFLKHIERCTILIHLIDVCSQDVVKEYQAVRNELYSYSLKLADKQEIICLNKCDALTADEIEPKKEALQKLTNQEIFLISTYQDIGLKSILLEALTKLSPISI